MARKCKNGRKTKAAPEQSQCTNAEIAEAFRRFEAVNSTPRGELNYINPFTLLLAVLLSAQETPTRVNRATPDLFRLADTPEKMIKLGEERVRDLIKTIGLYRIKAKNMIAMSQQLIAQHAGEIPRDRDALPHCLVSAARPPT
jgi:endonuclease III